MSFGPSLNQIIRRIFNPTGGPAATESINVNVVAGGGGAPTASAGRSKVALARKDYSSGSVSTAAYTQLIASLSDTVNSLFIFDSSSQTLVLAVGAAGFEVDQIYITPGGNGQIDLAIPSGSRVSIKAVSGTANTGELNVSFLK